MWVGLSQSGENLRAAKRLNAGVPSTCLLELGHLSSPPFRLILKNWLFLSLKSPFRL
jgi:hypothetical protein